MKSMLISTNRKQFRACLVFGYKRTIEFKSIFIKRNFTVTSALNILLLCFNQKPSIHIVLCVSECVLLTPFSADYLMWPFYYVASTSCQERNGIKWVGLSLAKFQIRPLKPIPILHLCLAMVA